MSNNPPDYELELTKEEAEFLLRNCNSNIAFSLANLQHFSGSGDRKATQGIVDMIEKFKSIRKKLTDQGVQDDS